MSNAFKESPTPKPEREPESGLVPEPGAELDAEDATDADLANAEAAKAHAPAGPNAPAEDNDGTGASSASTIGDLTGLEVLLSDDFARIAAERDEYLDSLQRLQADFNNFRKRTDRLQAELRDRANEVLLRRLMPVLDALDLALAHLGLGDAPPADEAAASLLQVNALLRDTLQREGLERIDSVGVPFDPTIHDATAMDESAPTGDDTATADSKGHDGAALSDSDSDSDKPTGPTVAEVWRAGYRLNDRVIRPAMVRVRN
jgi:molecular chaperone GrpE